MADKEQPKVATEMKKQAGQGVMPNSGPNHMTFWSIALFLGMACGLISVGFRLAIEQLQRFFYSADDVMLASAAQELPWYTIVFVPILGGLTVGLILHFFNKGRPAQGVAEVIQGAAMNEGRVSVRAGIASAVAAIITLSTGGSSGREGPIVHLAAVISSFVSNRLNANGITARDLLGCAVAAAVSAMFNAPIAGAVFAMEVILRHFALHAFAPIVIAAVAGTVVNRMVFGNATEYASIEVTAFEFYLELPAFLLLGLFCGILAVAQMRAVFWTDDFASRMMEKAKLPTFLRPMIAGIFLGLLALQFPHIIGVGYETTSQALAGEMLFYEAVVFAILKLIAVAITLGGRMGGGIFTPSLMLGALGGLAFGTIATGIFPLFFGSHTLYALAGMGAVAAAVLGAPLSTTLIVFELTGDWHTGLAVLVAVSMSTALASRFVDHSFFLTMLERRNIHLAAGPQSYLLAMFSVATVMRARNTERAADDYACWELVEQGVYVDGNATLEAAMPLFERTDLDFIPVVTLAGEDQPPELWGALFQVDALRAYNQAMRDTAAEEHS